MGLLDFFIKQQEKADKAKELDTSALANLAPGVYFTFGGKLDRVYSGWVYAAVRAIAEAFAAVPLELYEVDSQQNYTRVWQHDLLDLLNAPNPEMTGAMLKALTISHLELKGNAYWYLDGVTDEKSKPTAIYVLDPSRVQIIREQGVAQKVIRYDYRAGAKLETLQPYQVIHLRVPNPTDPITGYGTAEAAQDWIDADAAAQAYNKYFFENGARPGLVLKSKKHLSEQAIEMLRNTFNRIYAGVKNANKVAVLPNDMDLEKLEWSNSDIQFSDLLQKSRDAILAAFRVPRTALGITDDVNRANAEATDYVFMSRNIKPKVAMFVDQLNAQLVPRFDTGKKRLVLSFEDPTPDNAEIQIQKMKAATNNAAVMSINEARDAFFGLPPIENGDAVLTEFNKIPLGAPKDETKSAKEVKKNLTPYPRRKKATSNDKKQEILEAIQKALAEQLPQAMQEAIKKQVKNLQDITDGDFEETYYKAFKQRVSQYEEQMKNAIKSYNEQIKPIVVANAKKIFDEKKSLKTKASPKDLFNLGEWSAILQDLTLPFLYALYNDEATAAATMIGLEAQDFLTPEAKEAIDHAAELYSQKYNETLANLVFEKIEENQKEGANWQTLVDDIDAVFDYSNTVRAEMVARTETFRVGNYATKQAWKQSGVVKTIKWYTAADERVCEFCGPMHGKVIDINDKFFELGDELVGENGASLPIDYTDIEHPPLHPSCRCYIRPWDIE